MSAFHDSKIIKHCGKFLNNTKFLNWFYKTTILYQKIVILLDKFARLINMSSFNIEYDSLLCDFML